MAASSRSVAAAAVAAAILCAAPAARAQAGPAIPLTPRLQIAAFTGWQASTDVDVSGGTLELDGAQSFGASLWYAVRPRAYVEVLGLYSRAEARLDSDTAGAPSSRPFDVDMTYFQVGGALSVRRGALEPFGGGTLGLSWYSPGSLQASGAGAPAELEDTWRFAFTFAAGLNAFVTPAFAVRLQGRVLLPVYVDGAAFFSGPGGAALAVSGGIPTVQGDLGVGLVLAR